MRFFQPLFLLVFITSVAFAVGEDNKEIPQGMEMVELEGQKMILPEGTQVKKNGASIVVEGTAEYAARRFKELEDRLIKMQENEDNLKKEIESLKETIQQIQKKLVKKVNKQPTPPKAE